jgi:hypothetical protein
VRAAVSLAWARLRHRPTRWLLVCLGVAAATVLPVSAQGTATVVAAAALRHGLESLPAGDRSIAANRQSVREPTATIDDLDRQARRHLARLSSGRVHLQMLTHQISDGRGGVFYYGAADDLPALVRLLDGRLPASCTPDRCEVLAIGAGPAPDPALGIVVVGRAERVEELLFSGAHDPGDGGPILVADGVRTGAQLESLSAFQRSYAWITPVDLGAVNAVGVEAYLARSARVAVDLSPARLTLTAPDDVLREEASRAQGSSRRFALLAASSTALLLGFAAIGAIGLRRDHTATVSLLRRRGGRRRHTAALVAVVATVPVALGTVAGAGLGALVVWWLARSAGLDPAATAVAALGVAAIDVGLGALAAVAVVAVALSLGGSRPPNRVDGVSGLAWRAVDIVVVAGSAVAAVAVARGAVTAGGLGERTDPLLLVLPVLAVVCGGLLAARAWPFVTGGVARLLPRRWFSARLGLLGAARGPLRPVATVAFLAAAVGVVGFAGGYQATLRQGAADQATFAVPLDATLRAGPGQRSPLDAVTPRRLTEAMPGVSTHPVIRTPATVRIDATRSQTPTVVGVDPDALPAIRYWGAVVGAAGPTEVARGLRSGPSSGPGSTDPDSTDPPVPAGTRTLSIDATGTLSDVDVSAWLRLPDGRDLGVALAASGRRLVGRLDAPLPAPARLFALTLSESTFAATHRQHHIGEGRDLPALTGRLDLGPARFDAVSGGAAWTGWASDTATVTAGATALSIEYTLTGEKVVVRSRAAPGPLAVYADATTASAANGGVLSLRFTSGTAVPARVVGVLPRFPTVGARFVVADAAALAEALDARDPGTGSVRELWLAALRPDALAAALADPPFDRVQVDLRQARLDRLAGDPVARGASDLLARGALLCFAVALVALVLLVVAERRDEAAQLYTWEADGVAPGTLRRALFLRSVAVVVVGVPAGVAIGALLSLVTAALIRVTAVGTEPVPPLRFAVTPTWTAVGLGIGLAVALAVCAAVAAGSLRERLPRRPEEVSP